MIESDTVRLLRECDAGVKMGMSSIGDVLGFVRAERLRERLNACKSKHAQLDREIQTQLDRFGDEGKNPNPIAKKMSWLKTNVRLTFNESDQTIAELMTDGCNMGVKSLSRYLNEFKAADESSKDIAKRLIDLEGDLAAEIRPFL